jgi:hypothetical protein
VQFLPALHAAGFARRSGDGHREKERAARAERAFHATATVKFDEALCVSRVPFTSDARELSRLACMRERG